MQVRVNQRNTETEIYCLEVCRLRRLKVCFHFISLRINSHLSFPGKPVPSEELIYVFMFDYLFNVDRMSSKRGDIFRSGQ